MYVHMCIRYIRKYPVYELFGRGHGPSKLRSMLLVVVICNPVELTLDYSVKGRPRSS
jgi:hypothetical protein